MNEALKTAAVAVIVVNWNAGEHLERCLRSIYSQTMRPRRVILVDNASSDGSADGVENRFPGVQIVRLNYNAGFAVANNIAARMAADCEWIALLNPDAFAEPDWLERLITAARDNPGFSFFGSRTLNAANPRLLDGAGDVYHISGAVWRRGYGLSVDVFDPPTEEVFAPCAAAAMYKTADFLAVGGFDESHFCYLEDIDIAFRLRLLGGRCLYVRESTALHVGSGATSRHSDFAVYHGHRNLVWTFFKNMPAPFFLLYLPLHLLANIASVVFFVLQGQGRVTLKAKFDAIKGLPEILRRRKEVQQMRIASAKELRRVMAGGFFTPFLASRRRKK
ncbi:MAG: glycosyltransferase family 2 protein [Nitrospinae bacterium]|nr:glycosyltransferase family 2 protein [Nitrospinota bacterium]